jgi:hypothetical protein
VEKGKMYSTNGESYIENGKHKIYVNPDFGYIDQFTGLQKE